MAGTMWDDRLSRGARQISSSAIRDLLKVIERPEMISFAGGLPAPECFPTDALAEALARVMAAGPTAGLQYGPTEGHGPLRAWIAARLAGLGLPVPTEQVVVTAGSQQALDLLGKLLIDPDAPVAVEDPTYLGALQAWRPYQPRFVTVPMDDEGLDVAALERLLAAGVRPRFLYVVSCFQNPTGVTLSPARKRALVELAARHRLPIVEDDPYGELYYAGDRPPLLAAIDAELHGELRHVVYLSTFSKVLAPGLRVGWVAAPAALVPKLVQAKQGLDLHTGSLAQVAAHEACRDGLLDRHVPEIRATYGRRRAAMLEALAARLPRDVSWTRPDGGMFVWLTLPPAIDAVALLEAALERGVAFVPGGPFHANGGGANTLRLNFTHAAPDLIAEGVARLGRALEHLEHRR